jgi:hypothetical protein
MPLSDGTSAYTQRLISSLPASDAKWSGTALFLEPGLVFDYAQGNINPHTKQHEPIVLPGELKGKFPEWLQAQKLSGWDTNPQKLAQEMPIVLSSVCLVVCV